MTVIVEELQAETTALRQRVTELEAALALSQHQEERLRIILNTTTDWIWEVDINEVYTYVSPGIATILGYEPRDVLGKTLFDLMPPAEAERVTALFEPLAAAQKPIPLYEKTLIHKDGHCLVMETSGTPFYDQHGVFCGYRGIDRDITQRRQIEIERDQFFNLSADLLAIAGLDGHFKRLNPSWSRVLGWTEEELYAEPFLSFVHPDDHAATIDASQSLSEEHPVIAFVNRYRCKDGSYRWIEWVATSLVEQQRIYAVARDITERKQIEEQLTQSQALIQSVLDNLPALVYVRDRDYRFVLNNQAYYATTRLTAEQVLGQRDIDLFPPDVVAEWRGQDEQVIASEQVQQFEHFYQSPAGARTILTIKFPIYDPTGAFTLLGGISLDITAQKQAEADARIFQTLAENAPDSIVVAGLDGQITYANSTFRATIGYGDDIIGSAVGALLTDESRERLPHIFQQVHEQGAWQGVVDHQRQDGSSFPSQVSVGLISAADGTPYGFGAIIRDITEQMQREEELRIFRTLVEHMTEGVAHSHADTTFFYVNPAYQALTGQGETLIGKTIFDVYQESPEVLGAAAKVAIAEGSWQGPLTVQRPDGTTVPCEVSVVTLYDEDDQPQTFLAVVRDITEQQQAAAMQQRLVALVENSPDFIGLADLDGQPLYINGAARRMVGLDNVAAFERTNHIEEYFAPEMLDYHRQQIMPAVMQDGQWEGEFSYRHFKTGESISVYFNLFTVTDAQRGHPIGFGTVTRDLTEQKRGEEERATLQQQVIDAQQAAIRELSTPLIPIVDDVVIMPIIGTVDSARAQQVLETLLTGVAVQRATIAILDITGVQMVDTQVANALIRAARAVKLLGAQVVLTGIRPEVAQTLVHLGVELSGIITRSTLQAGIAYALTNNRKIS